MSRTFVTVFVAGAAVTLVGAVLGGEKSLPDRVRTVAWRVSLVGIVPMAVGLVGAVAVRLTA